MCCENVYNLNIHVSSTETTDKIVFQRQGNYGRNWNYGQVTLNETVEFKVGKHTLSFLFVFLCLCDSMNIFYDDMIKYFVEKC